MASKTAPIVRALEDFGKAIHESSADTKTLQEQHGWNFPPLNTGDMAILATSLATKIKHGDESKISAKYDPSPHVARIKATQAAVLPHLSTGNASEAFRTYQSLLQWIEATFDFMFSADVDWERVSGKDRLPKDLARNLRSLKSRLASLTGQVGNLDEQIDTIKSAHEAALSLPTDLDSLEEARTQINKIRESIQKSADMASSAQSEASSILEELRTKSADVSKLVERTEDAYSAATTKGLGEAFQIRANRLSQSMWVWVSGLMIALGIGGWLTLERISALRYLLQAETPESTMIWMNIILGIVSVVGPVWFAWVATKQIGQRFRLSEDYAFKASVARAYEGYRREAARLDEKFAAKLFSSALDRLEEAPLRYVEHETFGSPWQEMAGQRTRSLSGRAVQAAKNLRRKGGPEDAQP